MINENNTSSERFLKSKQFFGQNMEIYKNIEFPSE
jgi:hypothetical protein